MRMKGEEGDFNQKMLWASFFNNHKKKNNSANKWAQKFIWDSIDY